MENTANIHGTAIVLGSSGFLFVGPSGTGKSSLALSCLAAAKNLGLFAALVGDDRVIVSEAGGRIIARGPASISGLAEIRGAGIVHVETISAALLHFAILPVSSPFDIRLPPDNEDFFLPGGQTLPLYRLPYGRGVDSFDVLRRVLPQNTLF